VVFVSVAAFLLDLTSCRSTNHR